MMKIKLTLMVLLWALSSLKGAQAHQMKEAISIVYFNSETSLIEVSHRIYIHDAEVAAKQLWNKPADIIKSEQTQQAFANYIHDKFQLTLDKKEQASLKLLGHETKGQFFWVYQEIPYKNTPKHLLIRSEALMEVWQDQRNVVNVEGLGDLVTLELILANKQMEVDLK